MENKMSLKAQARAIIDNMEIPNEKKFEMVNALSDQTNNPGLAGEIAAMVEHFAPNIVQKKAEEGALGFVKLALRNGGYFFFEEGFISAEFKTWDDKANLIFSLTYLDDDEILIGEEDDNPGLHQTCNVYISWDDEEEMWVGDY